MSELITATMDDEDEVAARHSRTVVPPIRPTDGERLMQFWRHRDEAALAEVIELHAGMVWGVCSQVLRRREDVEDAFQATFLILARKARSIRAADSAAGWLYRVAFRTALLARARRNRRAETPLEYEPASSGDDQLEAIARNEQCRVLLEELHALPLKYRQPLVLCYLEGRSRTEAADELGVTPQSVKGRLARGTRMLRSRMACRGVALSTTMAITTATIAAANAATPSALIPNTAALAAGFAWKLAGAGATATAAKTAAATLAEKGMLSMTLVAAAKPAVALLGVCLTAGMFAVAAADGPKGDGEGGGDAAVVLLADAGADQDNNEDAAADESADVVVQPAEKEIDGEPDAGLAIPGDPPRDRDVRNALPVQAAGLSEKPVTAVTAAPAAVAGAPQAPAALTAPIPPVAEIQPARVPAAAAFSYAESADPFATVADRVQFTDTRPPQQFRMDLQNQSVTSTGAPSARSLELEQEYWDLKAQGLKLKADAMRQKAQGLQESGRGSQTEILEINADAAMIEADLKLCELNKLRVKEQLEAIQASQLKSGSKGVQVRMVQQQLNTQLKPSPTLDVDGDFGPLTEEAVKVFQKTNDLEPTGVVDEKTAARLGLRLQFPGAPADVLVPNPSGDAGSQLPLPRTIEMNKSAGAAGGGGKQIFFRDGESPSDPQPAAKAKAYYWSNEPREEADTRAKEAARIEQLARAREAEANALRQQLEQLRSTLESLQRQQQAAAEASRRAAEEAARAAKEERAAR